MNKKNILFVGIFLLVGLVVGYLAGGTPQDKFGGTVHNFPEQFYNGLKAGTSNQWSISSTGAVTTSGGVNNTGTFTQGSSGTAITQIIATTCTILANSSIAATSTGSADCAVTGVQAGDKVVDVTLATTTPVTNLGIQIVGANASSTAGWVTFKLLNLTGAAVTPGSQANFGSSTQVLIIR